MAICAVADLRSSRRGAAHRERFADLSKNAVCAERTDPALRSIVLGNGSDDNDSGRILGQVLRKNADPTFG